jgi:hypothetical protein
MLDEFGSFSQVVLADLSLDAHHDQTPKVLLDQGVEPREIWLAICQQLAVPKERWQGKLKTPRHAD